MNKLLISIACIFFSIIMMFSCSKGNTPTVNDEITTPPDDTVDIKPPAKPHFVTCLSYNILGADDVLSIPPAKIKAPYIAEQIKSFNTDIICIQEARMNSYDWRVDLTSRLASDGTYGVCTFYDETGVSQTLVNGLMIFYKTESFELVEKGGQLYQGIQNGKRGFIWVKLRDKANGKTVFAVNTHWSINRDSANNDSPQAGALDRQRESAQLLEFLKTKVGNEALFACGDFNCNKTSEWFLSLSSDIYRDGAVLLNKKLDQKIIHCFINPNAARIVNYEFFSQKFTYDGTEFRYSDHDPLFVRVEY